MTWARLNVTPVPDKFTFTTSVVKLFKLRGSRVVEGFKMPRLTFTLGCPDDNVVVATLVLANVTNEPTVPVREETGVVTFGASCTTS